MRKIGIVAPGSRIDQAIAERVTQFATDRHPGRAELVFHPQCFLSSGHFAGDDAVRAAAFLEFADDPTIDAIWIARGGYGSCRILPYVLDRLAPVAMGKMYLGYSDAGALLAALFGRGALSVAHGPMPIDMSRSGGEAAIGRALDWLVNQAPGSLESSVSKSVLSAAFNLTILANLMGTPYEPCLAGHVIMLEEVSEHLYRFDRSLFQLTSNPQIRKSAGLRLGRTSDIPPNEPPFGRTPEEIVQHWCEESGIPYLGHADIGHDSDNKVVPFGALT